MSDTMEPFRDAARKYADSIAQNEPELAAMIRVHVDDFARWYKKNPGKQMDATMFCEILEFGEE